MTPEVVDTKSVLSASEQEQLVRFLIEDCRSTVRGMGWLRRIIIREDVHSGYFGYWTAQLKREHGHIAVFRAAIMLNSWYLKTLDAMKETLAHEYGHHWTLGHLVMLDYFDEEDDIYGRRVPWAYYRIRRLKTDNIRPDSAVWACCDKEILAEDYRCLFTPFHKNHCMESAIGRPSSEVSDYLISLPHRQLE